MTRALTFATVVATLAACKTKHEPTPRMPGPGAGSATANTGAPAPQDPPAPARTFTGVPRMEFNRFAVRLNLPVYWIADANSNGAVEPDEVASLLFYPTTATWVQSGRFTAAFGDAFDAIAAATKAPPPSDERARLVAEDLDQGRATLVLTDTRNLTATDRELVAKMQRVATLVDELYSLQNGAAALAAQLPSDPASQSLFRRNRGPGCVGPTTEKNPACSAIPGNPKPVFDLYPAELQKDPKFCSKLEARPDKDQLLGHFGVVRGTADALKAVPYTEAYQSQMTAIARAIEDAANTVKDPAEAKLVAYLRAAAKAFTTNDWVPADEAWAAMSVENSKWYVRVAPDETYWEPCNSKAGIHLTFARINEDSKRWQSKLVPVQQEMEKQIAALAGKPYVERKVTFHLPDFIDIVLNAGDDRDPLGATIGQSLPNWGPVANEGRGRTVAMTNINTDVDSLAARKEQAESLLDAESMKQYAGSVEAGLANTILHEAMHNLGPAHEYKVNGKTASAVFTGPVAQVMEELKAQTGGLWLIEFLRGKQLIDDAFAKQTYADAIVWAFGHTSQGMYSGTNQRKTYSQLAAIQIGYLMDKKALVWNPKAKAANGRDVGAFSIQYDKLVPAITDMMRTVAGIKARGDSKAANALLAKYVDGKVVPHDVIKERFLRHPKPSFVYAIR